MRYPQGQLILSMLLFVFSFLSNDEAKAQELNAKVTINSSQVQGTNKSIFETLQTTLNEFMNDRQWTNHQYAINERINCTFAITVSKYSEADNLFTASLLVQSIRPVYNSSYSTTMFNMKDANFNFEYQEYDKLEFRADQIDNSLTALMAYYAYLIIGLDMDAMSSLGGSDALQTCMTIVNGAQNMNTKGWKAFDDSKNRFGIINDYLDGAMEDYRKLQYTYYRKGLDEMVTNPERARATITEAIGMLKKAQEAKRLSYLPQLFTDYKRDELVSIYQGKGTAKEREEVVEILSNINASQNTYWDKISKN